VLSLAPTIFSFAPLPMKISTRGKDSGREESWTTRSDRSTLLAAFANTPVFGGGMKIAPRAKIDDGLLDVCLLGSVGALKLLFMFPSVYGGRHLKIKEVEYFPADRIRVETERPLDVYADGEYVCRTPVEVAIQPGAMRVVTP
jgi:diacylglycerol kinase family enzyme